MLNDKVNTAMLNNELQKIQHKGLTIEQIDNKDVENIIRKMLELIEQQKEKFNNLAPVEKLTETMFELKIPRNAIVVDMSGDWKIQFDPEKETKKNMRKIAQEILDIVDQDFDKAMTIIKKMK